MGLPLDSAVLDDPRQWRVVQTLTNGFTVAAHVVTALNQSRDPSGSPQSDYHAIIVVEPVVKRFLYSGPDGATRRVSPKAPVEECIVIYREVDQANYAEYCRWSSQGEEKDELARIVKRQTVSNVDDLVKILAIYNLKLSNLHIAQMTD